MQCSWNWAKRTLAWRKKRKKRKRQASAQATAVAAAVAVRDPPLYPITRRRRHRSLLDPCPVASTSRLTSPSTVQWTKTKLYGDALWTTVPVSFSLDPVAGISNLTAPHRRPCWTALRSLPTNRRPIGDVSRSVSVSSPARNPKRQQQQSSLILLTFTASYSRPIDSETNESWLFSIGRWRVLHDGGKWSWKGASFKLMLLLAAKLHALKGNSPFSQWPAPFLFPFSLSRESGCTYSSLSLFYFFFFCFYLPVVSCRHFSPFPLCLLPFSSLIKGHWLSLSLSCCCCCCTSAVRPVWFSFSIKTLSVNPLGRVATGWRDDKK